MNRTYTPLFTDDHSRVVLEPTEGDPSDYINASYIPVRDRYTCAALDRCVDQFKDLISSSSIFLFKHILDMALALK